MTNQTASEDYSALLGRMQKLESENRMIKRVGTLVMVTMAVLILMGQTGKNQALDADSLVIRDASGNVRITLGNSPVNGPFLQMLDQAGEKEVIIGAYPMGGAVTLGGKGGASANLSTISFGDGDPYLYLEGKSGSTQVHAASVRLQDRDKFSADLGIMDTMNPKTGAATKTSAASLILFGKDGKSIYQIP